MTDNPQMTSHSEAAFNAAVEDALRRPALSGNQDWLSAPIVAQMELDELRAEVVAVSKRFLSSVERIIAVLEGMATE